MLLIFYHILQYDNGYSSLLMFRIEYLIMCFSPYKIEHMPLPLNKTTPCTIEVAKELCTLLSFCLKIFWSGNWITLSYLSTQYLVVLKINKLSNKKRCKGYLFVASSVVPASASNSPHSCSTSLSSSSSLLSSSEELSVCKIPR